MKKGEVLRLIIEDVAFGGEGVGRFEGAAVFVPFTVDGDEVEAELVTVKSRYARGRLVRVLSPSPFRRDPPCPYYGRCGGCGLQHVRYEHQLALKERQVREVFARIGKACPKEQSPIIPSPLEFGYRQKATFHLAGRGSEPRLGFMAWASNRVVEVEGCPIVHESISRKYGMIRAGILAKEVRCGGTEMVIWADEEGGGPVEVVLEGGKHPIVRHVAGRMFTLSYDGFFQVNHALVGELAARVVQMCGLEGGETVVDAYAGVGLFSLFLAPKAGMIIGIEADWQAVCWARINLQRAGYERVKFFAGDVAEVLRRMRLQEGLKAQVVVLDPPREGCSAAALAEVAALSPRRIVYCSCNPATQARDCLRLSSLGYGLEQLQPLDMFPQTPHLEVVALLKREG